MNPELAARLLSIYAQAEAALQGGSEDDAVALVAEAGALIDAAGPPVAPDPALADLLRACNDARQAVADGMALARERLLRAAAAEMRTGALANAYARSGPSDARFVDRTG